MSAAGARPTALLLSPHPDDELLGCPAHLFALRDAGWRIVNLALSLGSDRARRAGRRAELELACRRAGFELTLCADCAIPSSRSRAGASVPDRALERLVALAGELAADLLVAPSPHDDHPAHEWAGRLALGALRAGAGRRLWLWGLWADVALPNSLCLFEQARLEEIQAALAAHGGELGRNRYTELLSARARAAAVLLPERVLGYGTAGLAPGALAEGVCELQLDRAGEPVLAAGHMFDARSFPGEPAPALRSAGWLERPSPRASADS